MASSPESDRLQVSTCRVTSMTGFARVEGGTDTFSWVWEARSVNGRSLDIKTRYPQGLEVVVGLIRNAAAGYVRRGSVSVTFSLRQSQQSGGYAVNRPLLDDLIALTRSLRPDDPVAIETLLCARGVVEPAEDSASEVFNQAQPGIEADLNRTLAALAKSRVEEGRRLGPVLCGHLSRLEDLTTEASSTAEVQPQALRDKLEASLADLFQGDQAGLASASGRHPVQADRLAQEVALLAAKADIREELDRLAAHLDQAATLLASGEPVGRRLDFLCQELNREANTVCSKSSSVALTRIGMEMKATIEQFREQVQNVE